MLALLPGPLAGAFGMNRLLRGWISIRRNLGVSAFLYGCLHLAWYAMDLGQWLAIRDELGLPGIWTGWLALAMLVPPAATSFDRVMFACGRRWKLIQRTGYAAVLATFAHWLLLEWNWPTAIIHLAPLIAAWSLRGLARAKHLRRISV